MFVAGAVCPHPPLLVPELAGGAVDELDALRAACLAAVDELVAARPDLLVVVGDGEPAGERSASAWGTLRAYGLPVDVVPAGADRSRAPELPLSLTVGAWLLGRAGWTGPTAWVCTGESALIPEVTGWGRDLAARAPRVAVLAMGAGSARRLETGPGGEDPAAAPYDEMLTAALGAADVATLLTLDAAEADRLLVTGAGPWQVLAAAVGDQVSTARLRHADTPYGVTYLVASWATA